MLVVVVRQRCIRIYCLQTKRLTLFFNQALQAIIEVRITFLVMCQVAEREKKDDIHTYNLTASPHAEKIRMKREGAEPVVHVPRGDAFLCLST